MYFDDCSIPRLVKLIRDTEGYLVENECHEGKIKGVRWRYVTGELDIGSNNFDKFGNSTVITVHTYCAVIDKYPLKKLLTQAFKMAQLIDYK